MKKLFVWHSHCFGPNTHSQYYKVMPCHKLLKKTLFPSPLFLPLLFSLSVCVSPPSLPPKPPLSWSWAHEEIPGERLLTDRLIHLSSYRKTVEQPGCPGSIWLYRLPILSLLSKISGPHWLGKKAVFLLNHGETLFCEDCRKKKGHLQTLVLVSATQCE